MSIELGMSKSGHDKNQIYLVLKKDEKFVYLVNGTTKPMNQPKKKNVRHVQLIKKLPGEVTEIFEGEMTDITIKKAIQIYSRIKKQEETKNV